MTTISKFEELDIWQLARVLANQIYTLTSSSPLAEDFALKDQMNRSAGSIMDNIAEGFGRNGRIEFIQFLSNATGPADELKSQLYRCLDRGHLNQEEFDKLYEKATAVYKKVQGFIKYLKGSLIKGSKFKDRKKAE